MTDRADVPPRDNAPWLPQCFKPAAMPGYAKPDRDNAPTADQRLLWAQFKSMAYEVWRKDRDAVGLYGSQQGFQYNARDSYNYSDFIAAEIVDCNEYYLTLRTGYDPRFVARYQARRPEPELGIYYITGYAGYGPVCQPGDLIKYGAESVLSNKSQPTIKRIISVDEAGGGNWDTVVELGQDCSAAMTPADPDYVGDFYCSVWNQDGNPEQRLHLQRPSYIVADKRVKAVDANTLLEDKIYLLAEQGVAHPPGFNGPVFWIEGLNPETGAWDTIPSSEDRLFIDTDTSGNYTAEVSFGTAKPDYAHSWETPFGVDLTETYQIFRIHYYLEDAEGGCKIVSFGRCIHHRIDETRSVNNYGAAEGTAVHGDGLHSYCRRRKVTLHTLTDEIDRSVDPPVPGTDGLMDTLVTTHPPASGVATFPTNGNGCRKKGVCDQWQASEGNPARDAIFQYELHAGLYFQDLWGGCNTRLIQFFPGVNYTWNYQIQRILHAGIQWLAGMYLSSHRAFTPKVYFNTQRDRLLPTDDFEAAGAEGSWGTISETHTDEDDNEFLRLGQSTCHVTWHNYGRTQDPDDLAIYGYEDGHLPELASFTSYRDPLNPVSTVNLNEIEDIGIRNVRDSGDITGRGLLYAPRLLPSGQIIYRDCTTAIPELPTVHDKGPDGTWERLPETNTFGAILEGGILKIGILRQSAKSARDIGTRIIDTIVSIDGNFITADLENVQHCMTFSDGAGSNRDVIWYAGGGPPIYPIDPKTIIGYNEPLKSVGSPAGGAMRGDSCSVAFSGYSDMRCVLVGVTAFGGVAADNYGDDKINRVEAAIGGYFLPTLSNLELPGGTGRHGRIIAPATGDMVKEGATVYTRVREGDRYRPATLATETFWVSEETGRFFFSESDNASNLTIRYGVEDKTGDYEESYTVATTPVVSTGLAYSIFSGADEVTYTYVNTEVQNQVGEPVTGVTTSDVGGVLHIQCDGDDAGKIIAVRTVKEGEEIAEPDPFTIADSDYLTYAKNKDRVVFYDDTGVLIEAAEALEGLDLSMHYADSVWYGPIIIEWAPAGTADPDAAIGEGGWTVAVSGTDYLPEHGRGFVHFAESFFVDKPASLDYRVTLQMMDHRGFVHASMINKTQAAIDGLAWVKTNFTGGPTVEFGRALVQELISGTVEDCTVERGSFTLDVTYPEALVGGWPFNQIGGGFSIEVGLTSLIAVAGAGLGMPSFLQCCDEDTVILEATMEVTGTDVQTIHDEFTNPGEGFVRTVTTEAIQLNLLRLHPDGDVSVLCSFPAGVATGTRVVDCTEAMQLLLLDRKSGESYSYILLPGGIETVGDSLDEIGLSLLNPMPEFGVSDNGVGPFCGYTYGEANFVTWGSISVGVIHIRTTRTPVATDCVPERIPPMDPIVP